MNFKKIQKICVIFLLVFLITACGSFSENEISHTRISTDELSQKVKASIDKEQHLISESFGDLILVYSEANT